MSASVPSMAGNPFIDQLDSSIEALIEIASDGRVRARVDALPEDGAERVGAIERTLTVSKLEAAGLMLPAGARLSPRWFESSAEVAADERYLPQKYVDGHPPGTPQPKPKPIPPGRSPTICGSVGAVVCVSVGS